MLTFLFSLTARAEWVDAEICRANGLLEKQKKTLASMRKDRKGKADPELKTLERDTRDFERKLKSLLGEYEKTVGKPFDLASCTKSE